MVHQLEESFATCSQNPLRDPKHAECHLVKQGMSNNFTGCTGHARTLASLKVIITDLVCNLQILNNHDDPYITISTNKSKHLAQPKLGPCHSAF